MKKVTIMFDIGDPTSLGKNNAGAIASRLSSPSFNVGAILDGSVSDQKVIEAIAAEFKSRFVTNDNSLKDNAESIKKKLEKYFALWHEKDPLAISPSVADSIINLVDKVYANPQAKQVEDSAKKKIEATA